MSESRLDKTLLNAKANLSFYFLSLAISFFTRKIFLDALGVEFVGFTGTVSNLLGFLNLAELGIGTAIGYVLYKPIFDKDYEKLSEIISVFGYIYRQIGLAILGLGVVMSCFLPLIFKDIPFDWGVVYFVYFSFLFSSLLGYFVNYKQTLLGADQRNYVVTRYFQSITIVKTLIQAVLAYYTQNYYLWAAIEIVFGIVYSKVLNWKINQTYPWLESDIKLGKHLFKKYPEIFKYTKQLFVHKIGEFVQFQVTPFLLYAFVSLSTVALYGNYMIIIDKLALLINSLLGSTGASIGNLIAEGKRHTALKVFWELMAIRMFIAGVIVFGIYNLSGYFIALWLGSEYVLNSVVVTLICCRLFIFISRGAVNQFIFGFGLFSDTWAPIVESVIFISVAIVGGTFWDISGVLMGGLVSSFIIVWGWKPIFLFRDGFQLPQRTYWFSFVKYLGVFVSVFAVVTYVSQNYIVFIAPTDGFTSWVGYSAIVVLMFSTLYFVVLYATSRGMRDIVSRIKLKIKF